VARRLRIVDHATGSTSPWRPSEEQRTLWRDVAGGEWCYFSKPRQVGATTAATLYLVIWAWANDTQRNRVRAATVVDADEKTRERARLAADFCAQLGVPHVASTERVVFANGSEIVFLTAGGTRAGAGTSFQLLHLSELPFWPAHVDTYGSLLPALGLGGQVILETTIDVGAPSGRLARDLWRSQNRYAKRFFSVEDHAHEYTADPSLLTDEEWSAAQGEGFTRRDSAAWWLRVALPNLVGNDPTRLMREYPQREEHMFQSSSSRWVRATPKERKPLRSIVVGNAAIDVWRESVDTSHQLVVGVDTAAGKERDRSAVAVVDKRDGALVATLVDGTISTHALAECVGEVVRVFTWQAAPVVGLPNPPMMRPDVVVEDNGIGQGTVDACRARGLQVKAVTTDDASKYDGLLLAKAAVEDGRIEGPHELAVECDELHRDDAGRWKGRKDLLMAIGFALREARLSPYRAPETAPQAERVDAMAILRRHLGGSAEW
jgi:hypothetical protein